uniref:Uncharacterized protein n=1 Tax=Arundo donax TaxID=35708 RepID=A0A0A9GW22_ARUDO
MVGNSNKLGCLFNKLVHTKLELSRAVVCVGRKCILAKVVCVGRKFFSFEQRMLYVLFCTKLSTICYFFVYHIMSRFTQICCRQLKRFAVAKKGQ